MAEFSQLVQVLRQVESSVDQIADALELWAVLRSHLKLAEYLNLGTINHPEVRRAPILLKALLANLAENIDRHINVKSRKIFDEDIAGSFNEIRSWQETGYSTNRTESNYPKRLLIWKAIYEDTPVLRKYKSGAIREIDITGRYDVSYESIIEARMQYDRVPYWYILNYGTNVGPLSGYPNVGGIHFLEKAEATIPGNLKIAETHLTRYFDALLRGDIIPNVPFGIDTESGWVLLYGTAHGSSIQFAALNFKTGTSQTFLPGNLPARLRELL